MGPSIDSLMQNLAAAVEQAEQQSTDFETIDRISGLIHILFQTVEAPHMPPRIGREETLSQCTQLKRRIATLASHLYPHHAQPDSLKTALEELDATPEKLQEDFAYLEAVRRVSHTPRDANLEVTFPAMPQNAEKYDHACSFDFIGEQYAEFFQKYQSEISPDVQDTWKRTALHLGKARDWAHYLNIARALDRDNQPVFAGRLVHKVAEEISFELAGLVEGESLLISCDPYFCKITRTDTGILLELPMGEAGTIAFNISLDALQNSDLILKLMEAALQPYPEIFLQVFQGQSFWKEEMFSGSPVPVPTAFAAGMHHLQSNLPKAVFNAFQVALIAECAKKIYTMLTVDYGQRYTKEVERIAYEELRQRFGSLDKDMRGFEGLIRAVSNNIFFPEYSAFHQALMALDDADLNTYEAVLASIPASISIFLEHGYIHRQLGHIISHLAKLRDQTTDVNAQDRLNALLQRYEEKKSRLAHILFSDILKYSDMSAPENRQYEIAHATIPNFPIEGYFAYRAIDFLKREFEEFLRKNELPEVEKQKCDEVIAMLNQAQVWARQIMWMRIFALHVDEPPKNMTREIVKEVLQKVQGLNAEESLLIPGGSVHHSVLYRITRHPNDLLSLEILNTGEGAIQDAQGKVHSRIISPIPLAAFNEDFLQQLIEHTGLTQTMNDVLVSIHNQPFVTEEMVREGQKRYPLQTRGSCTLECVMAFLNSALPVPLFRSFQLELAIQSASKIDEVFRETHGESVHELQKEAKQYIEWRAKVLESKPGDIIAKLVEQSSPQRFTRKIERLGEYVRFLDLTERVLAHAREAMPPDNQPGLT